MRSPGQDPTITPNSKAAVSREAYNELWSVAGACIRRTATQPRQDTVEFQTTPYMRMLEGYLQSLAAENGRQQRDIERLNERLLELEVALGRALHGPQQ